MAFTGTNGLVQVGVSMVLQDRFTHEAGRISSSFRGMMQEINDWNRGINMAVGYAYDAGRQAIGGMYKAYEYSAGVNKEIFLATKMSAASLPKAQQLAVQKKLLQTAKDLNAQTPLTAADIASGEKFLAMAGNAPDVIQKMIKPAAQLASIFGMPLGGKGGVADLITNIGATFNIPQTAEDYQHLADILGIATTSANMSLKDLAAAFQYSGADFRNAKVPIEDAAAAIGVLGDQGIQASSAGTALANMYRYLTLSITGQRKKGYEALKSIGIDPKTLIDANGNLKSLDEIITHIQKHLGPNAGSTQLTSFLYNAMGVRGTRAASALINDISNGDKSKFRIIKGNYGSRQDWTNNTMADYKQTPAFQIASLKANLENLLLTVGETLARVFNPLLKGISAIASLVNQIAESGFGSWVIRMGAGFIMVQTLIQGFRLGYMTVRMITMQFAVMNGEQTKGQAGLMRTNSLYVAMEGHLRTLVALQMELTGLQMAPGTRMPLPMGGSIGKSAGGRVTVGSAVGRTSAAGYANAIGTGAMAGVMANTTAKAGVTAGKVAATGVGAALKGVGGRILGFLGGPWGLGLSIGIPIIVDLLGKWFSKDEEEADEAYRLQQENNRLQQMVESNLRGNIQQAVRDGVIEGNAQSPQKMNINISGAGGNMSSFNMPSSGYMDNGNFEYSFQ